jgi:hypothetical protein
MSQNLSGGVTVDSTRPTRTVLSSYLKVLKGSTLPRDVKLFKAGATNVVGDVLPESGRVVRIHGIRLRHNIEFEGANVDQAAQYRYAFEHHGKFNLAIQDTDLEGGTIADLTNFDAYTDNLGKVTQDFKVNTWYNIEDDRMEEILPGNEVRVDFELSLPEFATVDISDRTPVIKDVIAANEYYIKVELDVDMYRSVR